MNPQPLTVLLTDEQLARLADMVAERVAMPAATVSAEEAAGMVGVSPATVRRWVRAGVLRPIPALRTLRFTRDEINRHLCITAP